MAKAIKADVKQVKMTEPKGIVGKFVVLWRNEEKQPCRVHDVDMTKQEVVYELLTGPDKGKKYRSRFDPSQTVVAYNDGAAVLAMLDA